MENQTKYLRNILKMNVKFYEKNVKYLFLPAAFLSKGFISGKSAPSCNYEEYLVEFLDKSTYFRHRTDFAHIKLNEKQDRGQSDIEEDGLFRERCLASLCTNRASLAINPLIYR